MVCFERFYEALLAYKEEYGDLFVPARYIVDGFKLGSKVSYTRRHPDRLTEEEFKKLSGIGVIWSVKSRHSFDEIYALLKEYKEEHDTCKISHYYTTPSGVNLGNILYCMLEGVTMTSLEEKENITELGFARKERGK